MPKTKNEIFKLLFQIAKDFEINISLDSQLETLEKVSKKDQATDQASNLEVKLRLLVPSLMERGHELGRRGLVLSRKEIKETIERVVKDLCV